ncbi:MAG: ABC transporter substrate-binding protein [Ilumatobacteraceae bacterium]
MNTTPFVRRALAALAAATVVLAACGGDGGSDSAVTAATTAASPAATTAPTSAPADDVDLSGVTLRVGDQVKLTQSLLEASGQADTPYRIEWAAFTSGPPLLEALDADAIDLGGVGDAPPIFAAASGATIDVVAASKTTPWNQGILVKGDEIADVAGLEGRKVAVAKGSSANWVLLKALQDNGLSVSDVEIVYLQPTDAQQAFANGSVDAWAIWDPFSSVAQAQGAHLITTGEQLGIPGYTFLVSSESTLGDDAKVAAIRDLIARYRVAQAWQAEHKDEWAAKYSELTTLPLELTQNLLKVDPQAVLLDATLIAAQQDEADAFAGAGLIPAEVDFADFVDDRFNSVTNPN